MTTPHNASTRLPARACKATTKAGNPCRSPTVGADGFCAMHSPAKGLDPSAMGRLGAERSIETRREQAKSVRDRLREQVEANADRIWDAFSTGLDSEDERTRIGAAQAALAEAYGRPAQAIVGDPDKPVSFELVSMLQRVREEST